MTKSELTMKVKTFRERIEEASQTLPDDKAQDNIALYPHWKDDASYTTDYRVQYNGNVYKCLQSHTAQASWTPTDAPSLWAKVLAPSPDVIPDWEQPDSTNGYMTGNKVRYNGHVYESLIDNNIWPPDGYPQGWRLVED